MSEIDLVILAAILVSAALGFLRGIVRALASIGVWVAAFVATVLFSSRLASILPIDSVQSPIARSGISAFILFFGTLVLGAAIIWTINQIFPREGMSRLNRFLGFGFGVVRGTILVTLLVLLANLVPELRQESWWNDSRLLPQFQKVAKILHRQLPEGIRQHFDFTD